MVYELAIMGRVRLDAHSLNNEGTVGNVTEPRTIVLADGSRTDGISGEMLKHVHMKSIWMAGNKDDYCDACKKLDPLKASRSLKGVKDNAEKVLSEALKCDICDLHGFLIVDKALARKSVIEFGWALALPNSYHRGINVHTRVAPGEKEKIAGQMVYTPTPTPKPTDITTGEKEKIAGQMVYYRPTRSGVYAFISLFQPWRIGLNELNYKYVDDDTRRRRYSLAIKAYMAMLTQLEGAMTTTRLPHIGEFEGAITLSKNKSVVPLISPLHDDYIERVKAISLNFGAEVTKFESSDEFTKELNKLVNSLPAKM